MESLSPECTPLKHAYDSCFNAWFEGYLQPALDGVNRSAAASSSTGSTTTPLSTDDALQNGASAEAGPSSQPRRIVTSWAHAIGRKAIGGTANDEVSAQGARDEAAEAGRAEVSESSGGGFFSASTASSSAQANLPPIDTRGKTRAQIKAEEYERGCGALWRNYQTCLQKAIEENQSLSTLLEAARQEHPLKDRTGLKGTAWDTENAPSYAERD